MKKFFLVILGAASLLAPVVRAGSGHDHGKVGHQHAARHGGIFQEIGDTAFELVVKGDSITLHIFDHDKPLTSTGAKAEVTLQGMGNKTTATLAPAGDNRLSAKGEFKTGVGVRATVVVSLPGKPETRLTFRLK